MDIVFTVDRIPGAGETLLANSAARYPGGKGLNQTVASARAGAPTIFVGALGLDENGDALAEVMDSSGIDGHLVRRNDSDTGQAFIVVDRGAENSIIVASGANAAMTKLTAAERFAVESADVLLMQLELPLSIVREAAAAAREAGCRVMLNAAPAAALDDDLVQLLDYLVVNEHEACLIAGLDDLEQASLSLAARVDRLVVTLGGDGSALYDGGKAVGTVRPPRVTPVDTTGAGDTFSGSFAAAISEGRDLLAAARFATAAAALSVQTVGAVPSVPHRGTIDRMLASV